MPAWSERMLNAIFAQQVVGAHHVVDAGHLVIDVLYAAALAGKAPPYGEPHRCAAAAARRIQSLTRALQLWVQTLIAGGGLVYRPI